MKDLDAIEARIRKDRLEHTAILLGDAIGAIEDLQPYQNHGLEEKKCRSFLDHLCYQLDAVEDELAGLSRKC